MFVEFPEPDAQNNLVFWSATPSAESDDSAWFLNFGLGRTLEISGQLTFLIDSPMHVVCVR